MSPELRAFSKVGVLKLMQRVLQQKSCYSRWVLVEAGPPLVNMVTFRRAAQPVGDVGCMRVGSELHG